MSVRVMRVLITPNYAVMRVGRTGSGAVAKVANS